MITKYLLKKLTFWTEWCIKINNTKFRKRFFVNQQTNKYIYMHNRMIPSLLKTVFHTASVTHKNNMFNYVWIQQKLWHRYENIQQTRVLQEIPYSKFSNNSMALYTWKSLVAELLLNSKKRNLKSYANC